MPLPPPRRQAPHTSTIELFLGHTELWGATGDYFAGAAIPEPGSFALAGAGAAQAGGLALLRRRVSAADRITGN
jgi:hypothetical protein